MNSTYELDLISRILKSEGIVKLNEIEIEINELDKLINTKYKNLIKEVNYPEKTKSLEEFNDIYNYVKMYTKYSMLIGKTVIGVMCDNQYSREGIMNVDLGINERDFNLNKNNSIPAIYVNGPEYIYTVNQFDFINEVNSNDMNIILDNFIQKRKIDLTQNIVSIVNLQPIKYNNIAIILIPSFGDKYSQHFKNLVKITDFIVLSGDEKLQKSLNYLSKINYKNKIYLKTTSWKVLGNLKLDISRFEKDIFENNNKFKYNIDFISMIDNILLKQIKYYKEKNVELDKNITILTKAILLQDYNNHFKERKKLMEIEIKDNEKLLREIEIFRKDVFEVCFKIINIIEDSTKIDQRIPLDVKREQILYERCEKLLQVGYYDEAEKIIKLFKDNNNIKGKILNLKLSKLKNVSLNKEDLHFLYKCNLKEDCILKSKIEFREELKINEIEAEEIVQNIKYLTTGDEFYIKAASLKNKNLETSKRFYKLGSECNHNKCKDELYNLYIKEQDNIKNIKKLADLLHKDANYYIANNYKGTQEFKYILHLKLAASLGNFDAIYDLAEVSLDKGNYDIAILLYDYLYYVKYKEQECFLKLGLAYYKNKQYYKSTDILEKCNDERAYYILGKIYEYGMGRMKDYNKAMEYYKKASDLGNNNAKTSYIKIKTRLEEKNKNNSSTTSDYDSISSYESYESKESYTSTGCFITTAACNILGKGEGCDELVRIKETRDTYIVKQSNGEELISEYYRIAPKIIKKINESNCPIKEYTYLWEKYINICYKYILEEKYEDMMHTYINMVEFLKVKYL